MGGTHKVTPLSQGQISEIVENMNAGGFTMLQVCDVPPLYRWHMSVTVPAGAGIHVPRDVCVCANKRACMRARG